MNATIDWHDAIVNTDGFFQAQFPGQALADGVLGEATLDVTAAPDDHAGVVVGLVMPHPDIGGCTYTEQVSWFDLDGAYEFADALATTAASAHSSRHLDAWSWPAIHEPEPVTIEVTTNPDAFDDAVYLAIDTEPPTAVLVSRAGAAHAARAVLAAAAYVASPADAPEAEAGWTIEEARAALHALADRCDQAAGVLGHHRADWPVA